MTARRIVGIQMHHSVNLDDASRFAVNMIAALGAARKKTGGDTDHGRAIDNLLVVLRPAVKMIGAERGAAGLRLQLHQADPDFKRYVDGALPWPDETPEGFEARCTCHDQCLYHDIGRGTEANCNCGPCPRHGEN